jgi:signal transduction histidine kinase
LTYRLNRATHSTRRLAQLVESLLDVSRISSGRMRLTLEEFDLTEAVREVLDRVIEEARRAGSDVRLTTSKPVVGVWDRLRIDQIVVNLVANALKYGGGKPVDVAVLHDGTDSVQLQVIDHGIGVSSEDLERIFGRFERAVSSRHYGGLGLGLYITRQIVAAHGGNVIARPTPGGGATFVVELPLLTPSPDDSRPLPAVDV